MIINARLNERTAQCRYPILSTTLEFEIYRTCSSLEDNMDTHERKIYISYIAHESPFID